MREVYFMDTSILVNILQIPGMSQCQERVMEDLKDYISRRAVLILPLATIIETGNHIAHISNGDIRLKCAKKMATFLQKTVAGEAPWTYNKNELGAEELLHIASAFPEAALQLGMGTGDLAILEAYRKYKREYGRFIQVSIWSLDKHLKAYEE